MPQSEMRLIKSVLEYIPKDEWKSLDQGMRGFYALYEYKKRRNADDNFDFVYVGMAQKSIKNRVRGHKESLSKWGKWTHFSVFEVWDNISAEEIAELEGLFRHLYRWDSRANNLNIQRSYRPLTRLRRATEEDKNTGRFHWVRKSDGWKGSNR